MRRAFGVAAVLSAIACTNWNALVCDAGGATCVAGAGGGSAAGGGTAMGGGDAAPMRASRVWGLGTASSCFAKGGRVACWGDNSLGQVGIGSADAGPVPPTYLPGLHDVVALAAGPFHACAVERDGGLWCWGANSSGSVNPSDDAPLPVLTPLHIDVEAHAVVDVAAAGAMTCVVTSDGLVYCWGDNIAGQVGAATWAAGAGPHHVDLPVASRVCAGGSHACAVTQGGHVYCWGDNSSGQLGSDAGSGPTPAPVTSLPASSDVACGDLHACALATPPALWCWGKDGTRGDNVEVLPEGQPFAGPTVSPGGTPLSIVANSDGTCALLQGGGADCWGGNGVGQLAVSPPQLSVPFPVMEVAGPILSLGRGRSHTCADADGGVFCWGDNTSGKLGTTALPSPDPTARKVPGL